MGGSNGAMEGMDWPYFALASNSSSSFANSAGSSDSRMCLIRAAGILSFSRTPAIVCQRPASPDWQPVATISTSLTESPTRQRGKRMMETRRVSEGAPVIPRLVLASCSQRSRTIPAQRAEYVGKPFDFVPADVI